MILFYTGLVRGGVLKNHEVKVDRDYIDSSHIRVTSTTGHGPFVREQVHKACLSSTPVEYPDSYYAFLEKNLVRGFKIPLPWIMVVVQDLKSSKHDLTLGHVCSIGMAMCPVSNCRACPYGMEYYNY